MRRVFEECPHGRDQRPVGLEVVALEGVIQIADVVICRRSSQPPLPNADTDIRSKNDESDGHQAAELRRSIEFHREGAASFLQMRTICQV